MNHPPTLDYQTPSFGRPSRGGPGWFMIGIIAGVGLSIGCWSFLGAIADPTHMPLGHTLMLGMLFIPLLKLGIGLVVRMRWGTATLLSGILTSIALAPLLGFGFVYAACAGWIRF